MLYPISKRDLKYGLRLILLSSFMAAGAAATKQSGFFIAFLNFPAIIFWCQNHFYDLSASRNQNCSLKNHEKTREKIRRPRLTPPPALGVTTPRPPLQKRTLGRRPYREYSGIFPGHSGLIFNQI